MRKIILTLVLLLMAVISYSQATQISTSGSIVTELPDGRVVYQERPMSVYTFNHNDHSIICAEAKRYGQGYNQFLMTYSFRTLYYGGKVELYQFAVQTDGSPYDYDFTIYRETNKLTTRVTHGDKEIAKIIETIVSYREIE